jgi:hypothetical protein
MKINSAREKGKRLEKFVCQQIEEMGLGRSIRTPGSGQGKIKSDIFSNLDFSLECKNESYVNLLPNIDQAKRDCEKGNYFKEKWCLISRDPRFPEFERIYATIDFWQFLGLLKKNSEPLIKEPDRELKYLLERLRQSAGEVIKKLE